MQNKLAIIYYEQKQIPQINPFKEQRIDLGIDFEQAVKEIRNKLLVEQQCIYRRKGQ